MLAQIIEQFGSADVFQTKEVPRPKVAPGHVLIKVAASSVNPIDLKIRSGFVKLGQPQFPIILHGDVSGVIEEVGEGVSEFQIGDEVYACDIKGGALADYMLVDAQLVAPKPKKLSFAQAAALPLVSITAWEALVDRLEVQAGQKVLIHGATGGVGHVAIQLAKFLGAKVYTTGSSKEKLEIAQQLGADVGIDYQEQSVEEYVNQHTQGQGFDMVFDTVGGPNLDRSFAAVKMQGHVAAIAARSTHDLTPLHSKGLTLHVVFIRLTQLTAEGREHHGRILREITRLVDEDQLQPLVDPELFSFTDVAAAHKKLESGGAVGKIVLVNETFSKTR